MKFPTTSIPNHGPLLQESPRCLRDLHALTWLIRLATVRYSFFPNLTSNLQMGTKSVDRRYVPSPFTRGKSSDTASRPLMQDRFPCEKQGFSKMSCLSQRYFGIDGRCKGNEMSYHRLEPTRQAIVKKHCPRGLFSANGQLSSNGQLLSIYWLDGCQLFAKNNPLE